MTQEEFEYWWNVIFQPTYTLTPTSGGTYPSRLAEVKVIFPKIPQDIIDYINENYDGYIKIHICYHGNSGTRSKGWGHTFGLKTYDAMDNIIKSNIPHNSKLMFKNKNNEYPNIFRWSILGNSITDFERNIKRGSRQGKVIYLENFNDKICEFNIDYGYSLRHQLNRWLKRKNKWINYIIEEGEEPSSYHTSEFKYYCTIMLSLGDDLELKNGIILPKLLNVTYISAKAEEI